MREMRSRVFLGAVTFHRARDKKAKIPGLMEEGQVLPIVRRRYRYFSKKIYIIFSPHLHDEL